MTLKYGTYRLWFARGDETLPWRLQHVDDLGNSDAVVKARYVKAEMRTRVETEYSDKGTGVHPPIGTVLITGWPTLNGDEVYFV